MSQNSVIILHNIDEEVFMWIQQVSIVWQEGKQRYLYIKTLIRSVLMNDSTMWCFNEKRSSLKWNELVAYKINN